MYVLIATLQYYLIPLIVPKYNNNVRMKECVIYLRRSSQNETMSEWKSVCDLPTTIITKQNYCVPYLFSLFKMQII